MGLLNRRFELELPAPLRRPTAVLAGTADFDAVNSAADAVIQFPAVSVYPYRVCVDRETRPAYSAMGSQDGIPRVPLRMHLLIAAWDQFVESELEWLGLTIRTLESEPILTGPNLHGSGGWGAADSLQVVPDELALDSMSEAFQALTTDYRLSLPYVARVIRIDGARQATDEPVATVAAGVGGVLP